MATSFYYNPLTFEALLLFFCLRISYIFAIKKGDYIEVVQNEDCQGRNALTLSKREFGERAYREKASVGQFVYDCLKKYKQ